MTVSRITSPTFNSVFDDETGFSAVWGRTLEENPTMSPFGPLIADIEISTICTQECAFCYKSNTRHGKNMSFETFSNILSKFPTVTKQIAFGIGDITANPDLWNIMDHCRKNGVVPNITVNGTDIAGDIAKRLATTCGAVAVSHYNDNQCFNAVKALSEVGLKQVNIHKLLASETLADCYTLIDKTKTDKRLAGLNAIVFLLLKPKGEHNTLTPIKSLNEYQKLMDYARSKNVNIGMDSCSAPEAFKTLPTDCISSIEPCESGLFSIYVDVDGFVFPCSFSSGAKGWKTGIDVKTVNNFDEIWYHPRMIEWRNNLLKSSDGCVKCSTQKYCRSCQIYDVTICKSKLTHLEVE
jgi:radical SAM protein with 4Fe4S-binding SPASM domain